jgi:hypothetical protein
MSKYYETAVGPSFFIQPFPTLSVTSETLINPSNHNKTESIFTVKGTIVFREQLDIVYSFSYESIPPSPHKLKQAYAKIKFGKSVDIKR